ncbi:MAG: hypothetical protein MUC95_07845, partial [Spirochaetes bacterium]|nr:hypothetical protein [Spirochaetota bacterium]
MEKKEVIYGRNPVLEYLKQIADPAGTELYISGTAHGKIIETIVGEAKRKRVQFQRCDRDFLYKYHSSSNHQGVVLITVINKNKMSDAETLEKIASKKGLVVLLDQLSDPH